MGRPQKKSSFDSRLKQAESIVVEVLALAESLFQTAGVATEKEREVNDVEDVDGWSRR